MQNRGYVWLTNMASNIVDGVMNEYEGEEFDRPDVVVNNANTLQPYRFEPVRPENNDNNNDNNAVIVYEEPMIVEPENQRLDGIDWCRCGCCVVMPVVDECVCCNEIAAVEPKMEGKSKINTIFDNYKLSIHHNNVTYKRLLRRHNRSCS